MTLGASNGDADKKLRSPMLLGFIKISVEKAVKMVGTSILIRNKPRYIAYVLGLPMHCSKDLNQALPSALPHSMTMVSVIRKFAEFLYSSLARSANAAAYEG